jgi:alpha-L-fucosidase
MDVPVVAINSGVKASASNVFQKQNDHYGPQEAFDNDPETRWATDAGTKQAWVAVDLGKPLTIQRVRIEEAIEDRVRKFEFQYRAGTDWKTVFTGEKIGRWFQWKFDPVTAREFRVNILEATEGPTISDIELIEQ